MKTKQGIYVGRFNPMHKGHETIIRQMFEACGVENCLIIIGSCNNNFSLRHFFSYEERRQFILNVFPEARVVGLPDYGSNKAWLLALDDILKVAGIDPQRATYFGGCEEDVRFFMNDGRNCLFVNRFQAALADISATRVRDCLIEKRYDELTNLLNPKLIDLIVDNFKQKWAGFKRPEKEGEK